MTRLLPLVPLLLLAAGVPAAARPLTADRLTPDRDDPDTYLIDGRFQRGEARLARMRRDGELPDVVRGAACHFDLAGDPGVAYYVRTCP